MNRTTLWSLLPFVLTAVAFSGCEPGSRTASPQREGFSLPAQEADPMATLVLGTSTRAADENVAVRFANTAGYSVTVPALASNPVKVGVPPYFDPRSGEVGSGVVSLRVVFSDGHESAVPGELRIKALPTGDLVPGTLTEAFLEGTGRALLNARADLIAVRDDPVLGGFARAESFAAIDASSARITRLRAAVRDALTNPAIPAAWARAQAQDGPVSVPLDAKALSIADRVVAGLLQQLAPAALASGPGSPGIEEIARDWMISFNDAVADEWLGWGGTVGQAVGLTAAVGGLAVSLVAATPTVVAIGTTVAIVGGVGFLASTFVPAASAAYLKLGARTLLDMPTSAEVILPELQYVAKNTIGTGVSTLVGLGIEEVAGETSAALFDVVNSAFDLTGKVGGFFKEAAEHVLALGATGRGVNRGGSYDGPLVGQGTFSRTFPETTCTWSGSFRGTVAAEVGVHADGSVSGSARIVGTLDTRAVSGSTRTFTCRSEATPFDRWAPITGTAAALAWSSDVATVFPVRFAGRIQGSTIVGRIEVSYTLGAGSATIPVTLTKRR